MGIHFHQLAQLAMGVIISINAIAAPNTAENFNSRKGIPVQQIRSVLQNNCWTFHQFDINQNGWDPKIEGDGAMVASLQSLGSGNTGIYTPLLNIPSDLVVSFDYIFNENFSGDSKRWLKICLANTQNEIIYVLEEKKINGANANKIKNYYTEFKNVGAGDYRIVILYGGNGGTARIAIDNLNLSATYKYPGGCNIAPVALKLNITGTTNRNAEGMLIDKNKLSGRKAFLVESSPDGEVQISDDGNFQFTPRQGFNGYSTSFVYRVCEVGGSNLCSPSASVIINFPDVDNISQLVNFKGSYKFNGNVELVWNTKTGSNINKYEIERSLDGHSWKTSGIIPAKMEVQGNNNYIYTDKVNKNTALKKDLYYRLKQIENDGTISTSRLMIVRVYNTRTLSMISVTPNPSRKDIAVNVQLQENSFVSMRIFDRSGNTIIKKVAEGEKGDNNLLIDGTSSLSPGNYMLEVIVNSKERMMVKLIKE